MLTLAIQWGGARYHPGPVDMLQPVMLILVGSAFGVLLLAVLGVIVPRSQRAWRGWRGRRRQTRQAANAERRARAVMSELCPHGWQAQITLFESAGPPPTRPGVDGEVFAAALEDQPRDVVALDWAELSADPLARPAVMRRVWAPSIARALEAMVADRQTDEALERIEQHAAADGALWPDRESGST